jgi:hypothetical protein
MMATGRNHRLLAVVNAACVVAALSGPLLLIAPLAAAGARPEAAQATEQSPLTEQRAHLPAAPLNEVKAALVRLPLAATLGAVLALRPRRRAQERRSVLVVQTQIMLAVVGAVVMLVVGNSLSRAFGIVGAAGLVRYRSTIDDPKEAVVMLCALAAGLASGVGLYVLAAFATFFMAALLWLVERFEPAARKQFELKVTTDKAPSLRPKLEGVLHGLGLEYELLTESDGAVSYGILAPLDVHTRDVSDMIHLLIGDAETSIEWQEKKPKK